jgi:NAD(P)-dependent dehydrogenase (short-subunit alcohol dehydrogenase family)
VKRLEGKSALITGAARGIGLAFARRYVAEGARVAIADIDIARAQKAAAGIGDSAIAVEMDVTRQESIDGAVAKTLAAFGQIDVLINNAAVFTAAPIVEIDRADYQRTFDINVAGTLFTLQAVARHMVERAVAADHQHGQPGWPPRRTACCRLLRKQGRDHQPDPVRGPEPHLTWHQRQRDIAWRRRWRTLGRRRCLLCKI